MYFFQVLWQNQQYQQELMRRHMANGITGSTALPQPPNNSTVLPPMPAHMVQPFPFGPGPDMVYRPAPGYHFVQTGVTGPLQLDPASQGGVMHPFLLQVGHPSLVLYHSLKAFWSKHFILTLYSKHLSIGLVLIFNGE